MSAVSPNSFRLQHDEISSKEPRFADLLSPEIWNMILEECHCTDPIPAEYRLVSQRFSALITPFIFRNVELTGSFKEESQSPVRPLVQAYAQQLHFKKDWGFDWSEVADFIRGCRSLRDIRWEYSSRYFTSPQIPRGHSRRRSPPPALPPEQPLGAFPRPMYEALRDSLPHVRLHLHRDIWVDYLSHTAEIDSEFASIPIGNVVSFNTCQNRPTESYEDESLQPFLSSLHLLEVLDLSIRPEFVVEAGRLPGVRELTISGDWKYTADEVSRVWNFSNLKSLVLDTATIVGFIASVQASDIAKLKRIMLLPRSGPLIEQPYDGRALTGLIAAIDCLDELDLYCVDPRAAINLLPNHSHSLRCLTLDDATSSEPQLKASDLDLLNLTLPYLTELRIDLNFPRVGPEDKHWDLGSPRLTALAKFRNLRRLKIRSQTFATVGEKAAFRILANKVTKSLHLKKVGVPFVWVSMEWRNTFPWITPPIEYRYSWDSKGVMNVETS